MCDVQMAVTAKCVALCLLRSTCPAVGDIAPTFLFASAMFNFVLLLHNLVSPFTMHCYRVAVCCWPLSAGCRYQIAIFE